MVLEESTFAKDEQVKASDALGHVFVVEDDQAMRESMQRVLNSQGYRVYAFDDPLEFLQFVTPVSPSMVLLDMRLPTMTGVQVQARLTEMGLTMPVVFVSGESTAQQVVTAMNGGAASFLIKPVSRNDLLAAVAQAVEKHKTEQAESLRLKAQQSRLARLARREREVLDLLLAGHGNQEVSLRLGISYATAKQYKSNIMIKLNVHSMAELMELMRPPQ